MTPNERNRSHVREAIRFMSAADLVACATDALLPAWARKMYTEAAAKVLADREEEARIDLDGPRDEFDDDGIPDHRDVAFDRFGWSS